MFLGGGKHMKGKKVFISLLVMVSILAAPLTVFAAHTHSWGPTMYYGFSDDKPLPWENRCVIRHVYNYRSCLTCGVTEIWEATSYEMQHHMVDNVCVYCGKGYAR